MFIMHVPIEIDILYYDTTTIVAAAKPVIATAAVYIPTAAILLVLPLLS